MDFHLNHAINSRSLSSSSSTTYSSTPNLTTITTTAATAIDSDPMQSWWESVSKARSRIHALSSILPSSSESFSLSSLADSDRPALSLLSSPTAYSLIASSLSSTKSGSGSDPLCHWLYDTFLSSDPHLRLVVLSFLPLLSFLYLSRIHSSSSPLPSLAGFEAVLLALYASETKSRSGKPLLISIPDLSHPSLYHSPKTKPASSPPSPAPSIGLLSPPLEPQSAVKSTKRACIVGVALHSYYKQISQMPSWSKLDFCRSASAWAGQDCFCNREFESEDYSFSEDVVEEMGKLGIERDEDGPESKGAARIPLPWELWQPVLRILGHCLLGPFNSQDVKDAASVAVRSLYARANHDLVPQGILATRSLIQLDKRARAAVRLEAEVASASSNANTPSKAKKPEILLVSK